LLSPAPAKDYHVTCSKKLAFFDGPGKGGNMLSIQGPAVKTCGGMSRRELLRAGGLGLFGLSLPDLFKGRAQAAANGPQSRNFGRAKSCLIIFLSGGASHHDTFDMKPDAPEEIRGEFNPIASSVPGIQVCEHLPRLARYAHKYSVVRSLSHRDTNHPSGCYWMMTGHEYPRASGLSENLSRDDHPHLGAALTAVGRRRERAVPTFVTVPDYIAVNGPIRAGQHAGFLGGRYDPLVARGNPNSEDFQPWDLGLVPCVTSERNQERRGLLATVNSQQRYLDQLASRQSLDNFYQRAFGVLSSGTTQRAFDMNSEPESIRERYGRNLFGQSVLLGRRLVEAGVQLVHVNWIRILEQGWDTHNDNFNALRDKLLPPTDQALSALFEDMDARGLLEDTLVIVMGEFGRSPQITRSNAGREHWPHVFTILMAGAGIPGGRLYGSSDRIGAYVRDQRIVPGELAATIYHALGVDPGSQVTTMLERPWHICQHQPVLDLWS
jgi:hypothetical protein